MSASRTELKISEIFDSLQGEGPSLGAPCAFLRLGGCNLHCAWCDTRYTWDWQRYRYDDEVHVVPVSEVARRLQAPPGQRLVVTGGEPMLQQPALDALFELLPKALFVELETNGTFAPSRALVERVNQWNVSPKLSNGGDPEALRLRHDALRALRDTDRAYVKLVVRTEQDIAEADALLRVLAWPAERVLFMPEAATRDELRDRTPFVAAAALSRGVRLSTRLHVELWGGKRGA